MNFAMRRLAEGFGVSCIFGTTEKYRNTFENVKIPEDMARIEELKKFKMNVAYEGNEILQKLTRSLLLEARKMESVGDIKMMDVPGPAVGDLQDIRINDKLRITPPHYMMYLDLSTKRKPGMAGLMEEYSLMEAEIYHKYTQKQIQISRAIKFYQSKIYAEKKKLSSAADFYTTIAMQIVGTHAFLQFVESKFPHSDELIKKVTVPSRLRAALSMIPLGIAAAYLSPLDYMANSVDDDIVEDTLSNGILPSDPFLGVHIPIVQAPHSTQDNPFRGMITSCFLLPLTEGIVFRKLLLDAFLTSCSPLKAHALVATAATAVHVSIFSTHETYYQIKTSKDKGDYNFANPPEVTVRTMTLPYKPILLQLVALLTGRLYLSVGLDCALRVVQLLQETERRDDIIVSRESIAPFYDIALNSYACLDLVITKVLQGVMAMKERPYASLVDKLVAKQIEVSKSSSTPPENGNYISVEDFMQLQAALALHADKVNRFKMTDLLAPKCAPSDDTTGTNSRAATNSKKHEYHKLNIFSTDDDIAAIRLFIEESDYLIGKKYFNGRYSLDTVRMLIAATLVSCTLGISPEEVRNASDELIRRVFYWDTLATEEDVLDLIQEKHAHMREKMLRSAEEYVYTKGALEMLLLQGKPELSDGDLRCYYRKLDQYVDVVQKREELFFLDLFGLTREKYNALLAKWTEKSVEVANLEQTWGSYFKSEGFQKEIWIKANPVPVYRPVVGDVEELMSSATTK